MGPAVSFAGVVIEGRVEEGEFFYGPLFDGRVREALADGLGGLLCAREGRDGDEAGLAVELFGDVLGLCLAERGERIQDVVGRFSAGVGEALAVAN